METRLPGFKAVASSFAFPRVIVVFSPSITVTILPSSGLHVHVVVLHARNDAHDLVGVAAMGPSHNRQGHLRDGPDGGDPSSTHDRPPFLTG
jgi:hypothetical protein